MAEPNLALLLVVKDPELQELVEAAKRFSSSDKKLLAADEDLWIAANNSPSCGNEMSENVAVIKDRLRSHIARVHGQRII